MSEKELRQAALIHFGANYQYIVAIEECSELIQSITKFLRYGESEEIITNIQEEMADVRLMLGQLEMMLGSVKELETQKLKRLYNKIQKECKFNEERFDMGNSP